MKIGSIVRLGRRVGLGLVLGLIFWGCSPVWMDDHCKYLVDFSSVCLCTYYLGS
jgi:hypothetical protein